MKTSPPVRFPFLPALALTAIGLTPFAVGGDSYIEFELQTLPTPAAGAFDLFGSSVDIEREFVVIGMPGDDDVAPDAGAVHVYIGNGLLSFKEKLTAGVLGSAFDGFGGTVGVTRDIVAVGAPGDDTEASNAGAVYVFKCGGATFDAPQKITVSGSSAGDLFGHVAIDGDWLAVGAPGYDGTFTDQGAVYMYENIAGTWTFDSLLVASDPAEGDEFGVVALDGTTLVVGAWQKDGACAPFDANCDSGQAYVFEFSASWAEIDILDAGITSAAHLRFGKSVDIAGDWIVVGACGDELPDNTSPMVEAGAAYTFIRNGSDFEPRTIIFADDFMAGDQFGTSVAISAGNLLAGAPKSDPSGQDSGAVYAYVLDVGLESWSQAEKITSAVGTSSDLFGASVALDGEKALIGAPFDDASGVLAGKVEVWHASPSPFRSYCFGDGGQDLCGETCTACPCGNDVPGTQGGCENSSLRSAVLIPSGIPSMVSDTLSFTLDEGPSSSFGVLVSGDTQTPMSASCPQGTGVHAVMVPFDGLRCIRDNLFRHGSRSIDAAGDTLVGWPGGALPLIDVNGWVSGQTREFTVIYRDLIHGTCSTMTNTTNAVTVMILP